MYRMNETEIWNHRRDELVGEVESGRLARGLRAKRQGMTSRLWDALPGRTLQAQVAPYAQSGGRA